MGDYREAILPLANRLYRYAYRLTQNERDAEDLVQDTLLRALDKFDQYQSGTNALAWLLVIQRSIFINQYRKKKREGSVISFEDIAAGEERITSSDPKDLPETPEDFMFRNVLDTDLREALGKLSRHYLEVIMLVDMEDLSYREAAEVLNIPPGTVMSRLHRARKTLQGQLQDLAIRKGVIKPRVEKIYDAGSKKASGGASYDS
jgi:RNA polymerase sigma-70 factor (ECF subfamily)